MTKSRLSTAISTPGDKRSYARGLFDRIADHYDLANTLLSFNRDRAWKRRMTRAAQLQPGEKALDLACGTGDIALLLAADRARVVGLDLAPRMIELARAKAARAGARRRPGTERCAPAFVVGDMIALPFPDGVFDIVTTGYGLRNAPDTRQALAEIHRVLHPGGRVLSLDFTRPRNRMLSAAYLAYLTVVGAVFGWLLTGDPDTYRYIAETLRRHPDANALGELMESAGFERVMSRPVFGGFVALHAGVRGSAEPARRRSAERMEAAKR